MSAHEYCPGHGTEPTGEPSDLRAIECPRCTEIVHEDYCSYPDECSCRKVRLIERRTP